MATQIRRAAIVHGQVQGVSFRYYTARTAERLGLSGWVRNRPDGTVELEAQGDHEAVQALLDWAADGPPAAHVSGIEIRDLALEASGTSFRVTS